MHVDELTPAHVRRAHEIYVRLAWPEGAARGPGAPRAAAALEGADTLEELFARFERRPGEQSGDLRCYALRLGNCRYPFMKLVVQEYLVGGEMFFSVDTHDHLEIRPGAPDYEEWQALKQWNRELKARIEAAWVEAGLPTSVDLRALAEELAHVERSEGGHGRVLVVDDEENVARGVRALLDARGYEVETAFSGERVLDRLQRDPLPGLVVLDYEMPGVDGEEVLKRIRADPRTADLPVLMATASNIDLSRLQRVSGFLRKPYTRELLYRMVGELVRR